MKLFDKKKQRIIHTGRNPGADFWNEVWKEKLKSTDNIRGIKETVVTNITRKYLSPGDGLILEGGCGTGENVMSLKKAGFQVIGLDFAEDTVKWLHDNVPELNINRGDVRSLPYKNDHFAGYWSLGVIEHFQEGYSKIVSEMHRTIKKGGYLFLSFPYMSPLRKLKATLGRYEECQSNDAVSEFYEYFLNSEMVIASLQKTGFEMVKKYPLNAIKGIKDEITIARPLLQKLHDYTGGNLIVKIVKRVISIILSPVAGHSLLLVMRKKDKGKA